MYSMSDVLLNQLWGADCLTMTSASQLTVDSPCLKYIPLDVHSEFLALVAAELKRAAGK
jgi:hypothetical protein